MNLTRRLPRFAKADRLLPVLSERETWTREEIEAFQLRAINLLWDHAITHVPYYEGVHRSSQLPRQFDSLEHFWEVTPTVTKESVRRDPSAFHSRVKARGFWCRTGGSTGSPTKTFWEREANYAMLRTKYRAFQMWDVDYLDRIAFLWGHSNWFQPGLKGKLARIRQPIEDFFRNRLRLSAYNVGPDHLRVYLKKLQQFRPVALYGYPTALRLLADQAQKEGVLVASLRLVIATGEPVLKDSVDAIQSAFNVPVVVEYGSVECGHIAHGCRDGSIRVREDIVHLETIVQDELWHSIVVTQLENWAFPLIRYEIEDMSSHALEKPERGFAKMHDIVGRSNDFLIAKNSNVLHSARLDAMFKYQCPGIRRFRVHQHENGEVDVFVELESEVPGTKTRIERLVAEVVEYPVNVQVVDQLQLTNAGKHRLLVSDLANKRLQRQVDTSIVNALPTD